MGERARWDRALAVMLVPPRDTRFLQACLLDGEESRAAWIEWLAGAQAGDGGERARGLERVFAPLLLQSAARNGLDLGRDRVARSRARRLAESRRRDQYLEILRDVLSVLQAARIEFLVVKGAALAESVYAEPLLRHAHDIDLLLPDAAPGAARDTLAEAGYEPSDAMSSPGHAAVLHASGLCIMLHSRLFRRPEWHVPFEILDADAQPVRIAGVPVRVPAPYHALLHVAAQGLAAGAAPAALRWVCDAWVLARTLAADDWDRLVRVAIAQRLAAPLGLALDYLASELNVLVPRSARRALSEHAPLHDLATARDLVPLLPHAPRALGRLIATDVAWPDRLRLAWCLAVPSRGYMSQHAAGGPSPPGWAYVIRAGRWLTGRTSAPA